MATYNADNAVHARLVATVVDTVTLNYVAGEIIVYNRSGVSDLFFRVDGVNPVISGNNSHIVPVNSVRHIGPANPDAIEVRLVSAGIPYYSVEIF